jgi:hypothetical protein
MNGTRARAIRKKIYSIKEPRWSWFRRQYEVIKRVFRVYKKDTDGNLVLDKHGKPIEVDRITLQIRCTGKRAAYQKAKRDYREARIYGSTMRSL